MNNFNEFNITLKEPQLTGQKIDINEILNEPIEVYDFLVKPSKFSKDGNAPKDCLHFQIKFEGKDRVIFNGSGNLIHQIRQVPKDKFPFKTTITKKDKRLQFT